MKFAFLLQLAVLTVFGGACAGAAAHARWDPSGPIKPRQASNGSYPDNLKVGPCGNLPRSQTPAEFVAGTSITVKIDRTIYHQGHFRIAFSAANDQGFDNNVLIDNIPDIATQRYYDQQITLPATPCEQCTLQLIQTMPDSGPNSKYFSCADIRLTSVQSTAPAAPSQLTAMQQGEDVVLNWLPSANTSVVILESETPNTPSLGLGQVYANGDRIDQAQVVYVGSSTTTTLSARTPSQPYYYWAFAANAQWQYSAPATAELTLTELGNNPKGGAMGRFALFVMALVLIFLRKKMHR